MSRTAITNEAYLHGLNELFIALPIYRIAMDNLRRTSVYSQLSNIFQAICAAILTQISNGNFCFLHEIVALTSIAPDRTGNAIFTEIHCLPNINYTLGILNQNMRLLFISVSNYIIVFTLFEHQHMQISEKEENKILMTRNNKWGGNTHKKQQQLGWLHFDRCGLFFFSLRSYLFTAWNIIRTAADNIWKVLAHERPSTKQALYLTRFFK